MSERRPPLLRIAAGKAPTSDGIGSFYQEYNTDDVYNPRLDIRLASGMRMSIQYSQITEINFIYLEDGVEDITIYCQDKFFIRIVGKDLGRLYDALHAENVNWLRESRDNEQYDPSAFHISLIHILYIDNWVTTLEKLLDIEEKAFKKMDKLEKKNR